MPRRERPQPAGLTPGELRRVPITQIEVPPRRMRRDLGDINSLALSLESFGQLAPVVCYAAGDGRLRLIAGERRLEATKRMHAAQVAAGRAPADSTPEIDVLVRTLTPSQAPAELELIENAQRRELADEEEADAFIQLTRELGRGLQAVAEMSGRSVAYVSKRIRVFEDPRLRRAVASGQIATSQAEELLALPEATRAELLERSVAEGWAHDQMRGAVRQLTRFLADEVDAIAPEAVPSSTRRRPTEPPRFRVENTSAHRDSEVSTPRPRDLTRRIRELDAVLSELQPFQLTQRDDRALGDLWTTLRLLAQAARSPR